MDETMNEPPPTASCERAGLLLSLRIDASATPSQLSELDAHLPGCHVCRRAAAADAAVRRHAAERVVAPEPSWLAGFAGRTARLALAQAREARAQNRLLWMSAAAALFIAVTAQFVLPGGVAANRAPADTASVRESTQFALIHAQRPDRAGEGK